MLRTSAIAKGGDAIARDGDGRVVFVAGALPGETVAAEVVEAKRDYARARTVEVIDASPHRAAPPCPWVAAGCGGCDLQHVAVGHQIELKRDIVADALARQARRVEPPPIRLRPLPVTGYRTTVNGTADRDGRFAFRRRSSHDSIAIDRCLVVHPLVAELIHDGRYGRAAKVALRAGARTGERLVHVSPKAAIDVPDDVRRSHYHEIVDGIRFRISATSFFQSRPDGADALAQTVRESSAGVDGSAIDLYAGVGLFSATVLADRDGVVAVESSAAAVDDLRVNAPHARAVRTTVDRWAPTPAALVIADPPRDGLGRDGVARVAATGAERIVLVSCDPAAFARDVALLAQESYVLGDVVLVDLFGHTSHIELVSRFDRR